MGGKLESIQSNLQVGRFQTPLHRFILDCGSHCAMGQMLLIEFHCVQRSGVPSSICQTASAVQSLCPSNSFTTAVMFSSPRPSLMALRKIFRIAVMAGAFSSPPAV